MCVNPLGDITIMTRPNKIPTDTMSYNLTIEKKDYDRLRNFSTKESETIVRTFGEQVNHAIKNDWVDIEEMMMIVGIEDAWVRQCQLKTVEEAKLLNFDTLVALIW